MAKATSKPSVFESPSRPRLAPCQPARAALRRRSKLIKLKPLEALQRCLSSSRLRCHPWLRDSVWPLQKNHTQKTKDVLRRTRGLLACLPAPPGKLDAAPPPISATICQRPISPSSAETPAYDQTLAIVLACAALQYSTPDCFLLSCLRATAPLAYHVGPCRCPN